jgi:hypothetical protein
MSKAQAIKKLAKLGWTQVAAPEGHRPAGRSYAYLRYPDGSQVGYFCPADLLAELEKEQA